MKALRTWLAVAGLLALVGPPAEARPEAGEAKRAREAIEDLGGRVRTATPPGGKPYLRVFWESRAAADKDMALLKSLPDVGELLLTCPRVTDAGLAHLKGLTGLHELRLYGQTFTDGGLAHLKGLAGLKTLYVMTERLSDDGLAHLKGLTGLEKLVLSSPKITDAGLRHLKGLKGLKELDLGFRSKVTAAGVKELEEALPGVSVTR